MSSTSPHSPTGLCTPVGPMNMTDYSASGTQEIQLPDRQSQWRYDSTGLGPNVGQRLQTIPRFFRDHNIDISDVVASASERLLEENAFYMRLKLIAGERMAELNRLQGIFVAQRKELEVLKIRCDTYQETIDLFAKNYVTSKTASGDPSPIILMANLPLIADTKGETDEDSSTSRVKANPGRPRKDSYEDYFYLQNEDGTLVSREVLFRMRQKAQAIWETLDEHGQAPTSFDKISETAWDFYARSMLNDPELFFLRLCDDGQWKLKEWSNSSYSPWYDNRGVRQKKVKQFKDSILDDPNPIQLDSNKADNKTNLDDRDSGNGDDENESEFNCSGGDSYERHNTETPHPTSHSEKKRKTERKAATRSLKKRKAVETLAIPTDKNTIRNICMRHWNGLQPGGQGLASDFDAYFKTLSDMDKEPFKREMCTVPRITRKAKTAEEKAVPQRNA